MFGVVLWSSNEDLSAVIWCEDHQDLAIWRRSAAAADNQPMPEAGDLVSFDVAEKNGVREASNTVLVASDHFSGLPYDLKNAATSQAVPSRDARMTSISSTAVTEALTDVAEVVPFPAYLAARRDADHLDRAPRTGTDR